jgi:1-aminocyclopropane-1-carboxylate deaminase/D-cysteine desulfhydrase-like pyridoxal-dependent ACC family enzyme
MVKNTYFPWKLKTRVHRLNHFPDDACYVKREDELSCGVSGTKLRKYASIIPYCINKGIEHLVVIATVQSNNLLAVSQIAREYGFKLSLFLLKPWAIHQKGNYKLSQLFFNEKDIVWVEKNQWDAVESLAKQYIEQHCDKALLLPEGASCQHALKGAMTLADDIIENEKQLGISFSHIFIDAGTGFSACALLKSLTEKKHKAKLNILLLADDELRFWQKSASWADIRYQKDICFMPSTARSFGAINGAIKQEIKRMAMDEGILTCPIYSAKLFYESRQKILSEALEGNKLIIHSGGILSLSGFDIR